MGGTHDRGRSYALHRQSANGKKTPLELQLQMNGGQDGRGGRKDVGDRCEGNYDVQLEKYVQLFVSLEHSTVTRFSHACKPNNFTKCRADKIDFVEYSNN